jgi:hypothetical protein
MPNPNPRQTKDFKTHKFRSKNPLTEPLAAKSVGVRLYEKSYKYVKSLNDPAGFIRDAIARAVENAIASDQCAAAFAARKDLKPTLQKP